jgi:hypothetical protein
MHAYVLKASKQRGPPHGNDKRLLQHISSSSSWQHTSSSISLIFCITDIAAAFVYTFE